MERHRQRAAEPLVDPALLAAVLLEAGPNEAALYVHPIAAASDDEHLVNRRRLRPRDDVTAPRRVVEGLPREAEPALAVRDAVPVVVVALDLLPVVAAIEPRVAGYAKLARVVA